MKEPLVSIIIPVYNAQEYIEQCLSSIMNQTYKNFEVICVDDGSTDRSVLIINQFIKEDQRFNLICQTNLFAGVARNNGIKHARGKYLLFLDSDDFFHEKLLEHTVNIGEYENSDIVVYEAKYYDNQTKEYKNAPWIINSSLIPEKSPFSKNDIPFSIFNFTNSCPWNKLFRREFILENNLSFQAIQRANDLYFTNTSLIKAERISICNEMLVNYRTNNNNSLQSGNDKTPFYFFEALSALKNRLIEEDLYEVYQESFINLALGNCIYNLNSLKSAASFEKLYNSFDFIFKELDMININPNCIHDLKQYEQYKKINTLTPLEYLFESNKVSNIKLGKLVSNNKIQFCLPYQEENIKIVLYAAGTIGKQLYRQVNSLNDMEIILWVDKHYENYQKQGLNVESPDRVTEVKFDYIIVAVENTRVADEIVFNLLQKGINKSRILKPIF